MIEINCSNCSTRLVIPDQFAGRTGKCNHCGAKVVVPPIAVVREDKVSPQKAISRYVAVARVPGKWLVVIAGAILALAIVLLVSRSPGDSSQTVPKPTFEHSEPVNVEPENGRTKVVTCDTFEIAAELRGDELSFHLETDLPDTADIMADVSRVYFEKGKPGTAYSREYFSQKAKVADWRTENTCSIADNVFMESLQEQMNKMASIGMPFEVASISDEIEVSFVLPINQSDPVFGDSNANLHGRMVPESGLKSIRVEKQIHRPLNPTKAELPQAKMAYRDKLEIGSSYRLSGETPLMPEFEPADPLSAITRMTSLPATSTIVVRERREKRGTPWYRAEAYGPGGNRIGQGWINSGALIGQIITIAE